MELFCKNGDMIMCRKCGTHLLSAARDLILGEMATAGCFNSAMLESKTGIPMACPFCGVDFLFNKYDVNIVSPDTESHSES